MTPERWQQIETLLDAALDRDPADRLPFLNEACGEDAALYEEVASLLAAETDGDDLIVGSRSALMQPFLDHLPEPAEDPLLGTTIGPYRVQKEIGRGGMGRVYLAERADVDQQVALKVAATALASEEHRQRFLLERRVLARLNHPHIARFLDAGLTSHGLPYFVMEYVDGEPLTAHADRHRLRVEARLRLFLTVCRAVQYAHQNLIVHRDLKPSNILVQNAAPNEQPVVKLLDFGIAKLLTEDEDALHTHTDARLMTPAYAAPEQIRGEAVTTATDVYALGMILYELLTGNRPYEVTGKSLADLSAALTGPTKRPSTALKPSDAATTAVSEARSTTAGDLRKRLRGDLDTIVLKALRKDPDERYASAEQMADDVERHLDGLPVRARPGTTGYRMRKFIGRHRVGVGVAVLGMGLILGFIVREGVLRAEAEAARVQAELEAEKATQVTAFLTDLFNTSDPFTDNDLRSDTVAVGVFLDRAVARIRQDMADQPEVQAELMAVMGEVYVNRSRYDEAQTLLEEALAVRRATLGNRHLDVAGVLHALGFLYTEQDNYPPAEAAYREALDIRRTLLEEPNEQIAETLYGLANTLRYAGRPAEGVPLHREALAMRRALFGEGHLKVGYSTLALATTLDAFETDYATTEAMKREALAIFQDAFGADHPEIALVLNNLANNLERQGKYAEAEPLHRRTLDLYRTLLGPEHYYVAISLSSIARVVAQHPDRFAEAESLYTASLHLREKVMGTDHPGVARLLHRMAGLYLNHAQPQTAETLLRRALRTQETTLPPDHWHLADTRNLLGGLLLDQDRTAEAEPLLRQSLAPMQTTFGEDHARTRAVRENLARLP